MIYTPTTARDDGIILLQPFPEYTNGKKHTGIDIYSQAYRGHKPRATESGRIVDIVAGSGTRVSCISIEIDRTGDILEYKHCSTRLKVGDRVDGGQIIGELDDSGKDSGWWQGYHLHFGYRQKPQYILSDPVLYFLDVWSNIIFYMRDVVKEYYKNKQYYNLMIIKPIPWET